jgi:DNA repair protein RecN (Recombination protein N)
MISTSPATQPIPVQEIASGGELSRIFLAITASTVNASPFKTLIFDEIDTGIGGAAANKVGNCLRDIGKSRQLFAVTHLAQVAAKADHHIQARKLIDENCTTAMLVQLNESDRIEEVARMLDGHSNSEISKNHAKEILKK